MTVVEQREQNWQTQRRIFPYLISICIIRLYVVFSDRPVSHFYFTLVHPPLVYSLHYTLSIWKQHHTLYIPGIYRAVNASLVVWAVFSQSAALDVLLSWGWGRGCTVIATCYSNEQMLFLIFFRGKQRSHAYCYAVLIESSGRKCPKIRWSRKYLQYARDAPMLRFIPDSSVLQLHVHSQYPKLNNGRSFQFPLRHGKVRWC